MQFKMKICNKDSFHDYFKFPFSKFFFNLKSENKALNCKLTFSAALDIITFYKTESYQYYSSYIDVKKKNEVF